MKIEKLKEKSWEVLDIIMNRAKNDPNYLKENGSDILQATQLIHLFYTIEIAKNTPIPISSFENYQPSGFEE